MSDRKPLTLFRCDSEEQAEQMARKYADRVPGDVVLSVESKEERGWGAGDGNRSWYVVSTPVGEP